MNRSTPGLPVHHQLLEFAQTHVHRVGDAIQHFILCHPLLLPPPIPPSIRVFSNESALHIRWPKYWSFSFNISPSNEHPGLISFRMDWLDLLADLSDFPLLPFPLTLLPYSGPTKHPVPFVQGSLYVRHTMLIHLTLDWYAILWGNEAGGSWHLLQF